METSTSAVRGDSLTAFYLAALDVLDANAIPVLVGGTFAYARYTAIDRETKDLDLVMLPADVPRALSAFQAAGYRTEVSYPHWLAKVRQEDHVLDLLFSSGNGVARVDEAWFAHAAEREVLGRRLRLCPPEELLWSKAFVQERERFDGADVLHLLRDAGRDMDWPRLVARFGDHWPVLLGHLVSFYFVYPDRRDAVPAGLVSELAARLAAQAKEPDNRVCYGTLLSREQYLHDIRMLGYIDARLQPHGTMTPDEVAMWTEAIGT